MFGIKISWDEEVIKKIMSTGLLCKVIRKFQLRNAGFKENIKREKS